MYPTSSRAESREAPGERPRVDWLAATYVLGALLLLYYLVPLLALVFAQPPGGVLAHLGDADVRAAVTHSVLGASISTLLALAFGLPLAYWLARTEARWRTAVTAVVVLPLVLPPIVSGMVLLVVVGPNTALGAAAAAAGFPLTRSLAGIVLAQTFVASPFVVITSKAAFEGVDRRLEDASRTLGKDRFATFRAVTLPLARPGILAGTTLAFARALGEFGATIMLAYYPRTMPVQIWVSFSTRGLDEAFPVAVVLLAISVGLLVLLNVLGVSPWE